MKMLSEKPIPVYIINLKERQERKKHILCQFEGRNEFIPQIIKAYKHQFGNVGLWMTIKEIIADFASEDEEAALICEDDHMFTERYTYDILISAIREAKLRNADVLLGGVSWFSNAFPVSENLYWAELFSGTQFMIIFRKFFSQILNADFSVSDTADYKICSLTQAKFFIFPFISIQYDFGYSDATVESYKKGKVEKLFSDTIERLVLLNNVSEFYKKQQTTDIDASIHLDEITIPLYIINLPERAERLSHIKKQFEGRQEFEVTVVEACKHEVGALGLWQSIRKIIRMAMDNDDDVIIICEDDHEFTPQYSKEFLLRNILEAGQQGCDYLTTGSGRFDLAIPISSNRFWTNRCHSTQFIVVYRKFFQSILDEPFDETIIADIKLSEMTSNKMLLYPFISTQKDFGYSDVTPIHNSAAGFVDNLFSASAKRLEGFHQAYLSYGLQNSNQY